jgi:hypothetical protein
MIKLDPHPWCWPFQGLLPMKGKGSRSTNVAENRFVTGLLVWDGVGRFRSFSPLLCSRSVRVVFATLNRQQLVFMYLNPVTGPRKRSTQF